MTTLDGRTVVKEGWLTMYKARKPTFFSSRPVPDKLVDRGWAVLHHFSNKGPLISFYQDNLKETRVMRREKVELVSVRAISQITRHPKQPNSFALKFKGAKRIILNCDTEPEKGAWLRALGNLLNLEYSQETVMWEYLDDGGLWQACTEEDSFKIEAHFFEGSAQFHLGDYHYHLSHMTRSHPQTKNHQRVKRTLFVQERREVLHSTMKDLPAIWEWGDGEKREWQPFERDTNIQIEEMYDSGSQWAELTLCLPSPMPFLLDLHDMKLVNFRTAVRYNLRRIDQVPSLQTPQARAPSPDEFDTPPPQDLGISPKSPLFKPLQETLERLQMDRKAIDYKRMIGEGAFGEVFLAEVTGIPGFGNQTMEVAVKQLRLSDFIARHGHHSQQMEDFLREAKEMSKVDYPYVIKLLAVCTLDYPLLLIEEYMNNGDLLGVLKDSRPSMSLPAQLNFAFQVADGMRYLADELCCVHRDLAARNILVNQDGSEFMQAKIADFGLSRHLYSDMYKHQGTKPRPLPAKWMALESLMYFTFTTKSDVWSYGVLLWEIMTLGRSPYPGVENRELLEQIEEKGLKLSKPKLCPPEIYEVILDCTQHQENERPTFKDLRDLMMDFFLQAKEGKMTHVRDSASVSSSQPSSTSLTNAEQEPVSDAPQPPRPDKSPQLQRPPSPTSPPPSSKPPPPTPPAPSQHITEATPTDTPTTSSTVSDKPTTSQKTPNCETVLPPATKSDSVSIATNGGVKTTKSVTEATDGASGAGVMSEGGGGEDVMVEVTGGHLYYLLDPAADRVKGDKETGRSHSKSSNCKTESGRPVSGGTPPTKSKKGSRKL